MAQKRILIISQYPLFDEGLQVALRQQPGVEVIDVCRDPAAAYVQAQTQHPDVLLVIAGPEGARESIRYLLERFPLCLIRVTATDGSMQVYRREQVDQASLDDLIRALHTVSNALGENAQRSSG